jgi:hypothetical protein
MTRQKNGNAMMTPAVQLSRRLPDARLDMTSSPIQSPQVNRTAKNGSDSVRVLKYNSDGEVAQMMPAMAHSMSEKYPNRTK